MWRNVERLTLLAVILVCRGDQVQRILGFVPGLRSTSFRPRRYPATHEALYIIRGSSLLLTKHATRLRRHVFGAKHPLGMATSGLLGCDLVLRTGQASNSPTTTLDFSGAIMS